MNARRFVATAAVAGLLTSAVAMAPAAQAYDKDAYTYAAGHMIERSDIPKALGAYKPGLTFTAFPGDKTFYVCSQPQADDNANDVTVKIPGPKSMFSGTYNGRGKDAPFISANVNQYASATKAINAFNSLKKNLKSCDGTSAQSWTNDDGTTTQYSTLVTTGVVPAVTTLGVESLFVSINNLDETLPKGAAYISDSYTVYSLFNDTIIVTAYYSNTTKNLTTAQRKAVNQVAFNAETRWAS